jgi:hypothetical protein
VESQHLPGWQRFRKKFDLQIFWAPQAHKFTPHVQTEILSEVNRNRQMRNSRSWERFYITRDRLQHAMFCCKTAAPTPANCGMISFTIR